MVLAAPGPLLTPPPSSSPPKTPHRSYSAQTRSQNEEKNPPPKPYLPLQTRTRHRRSHRPHVPTLMRGNTPPTTRSPPHRSRRTGNPPNRQPATVGEEELGGRDPTSRRTSMRAAPDCMPPTTARHASQPRISTSHPPQQQDAVHRELRPGTGKGASAGADTYISTRTRAHSHSSTYVCIDTHNADNLVPMYVCIYVCMYVFDQY
jgi:hypothetical protein